MEAKVTWKSGMSFSATADSGFKVDLGTDTAVGGNDDGFRPLELMAISLAGCTAMDVISILAKKRQEVSGFEVSVHVQRAAEHPKVFTSARITYVIRGAQISESAVQRAIELSAAHYCPAQTMLAKAFPMELKYEIYESAGSAENRLVAAGKVELQR